MKKKKIFAAVSAMAFAVLSLTSCDVHFGSRHYDVPWYVVAVPTAVWMVTVFLVTWIIAGKAIASHKYVCPSCGERFYPSWQAAGVSLHIGDDRVFRCPKCGKRGLCTKAWDE